MVARLPLRLADDASGRVRQGRHPLGAYLPRAVLADPICSPRTPLRRPRSLHPVLLEDALDGGAVRLVTLLLGRVGVSEASAHRVQLKRSVKRSEEGPQLMAPVGRRRKRWARIPTRSGWGRDGRSRTSRCAPGCSPRRPLWWRWPPPSSARPPAEGVCDAAGADAGADVNMRRVGRVGHEAAERDRHGERAQLGDDVAAAGHIACVLAVITNGSESGVAVAAAPPHAAASMHRTATAIARSATPEVLREPLPSRNFERTRFTTVKTQGCLFRPPAGETA